MTTKRWAIMATGMLLGLVLWQDPGQARAGSLDKALLSRQIGDILGDLKKEGYETVGVLPFKVKKGTRQASYAGAPLAMDLPRRLENALIMSMSPNENRAIGIIRDSAGQANKARVGSYSTSEAAFKKLFDHRYNLAWGNKSTQADGFLIGTVSNTGDRTKTEVEIALISPKSWQGGKIKPMKTWTIAAKTDRVLLADLGYNFALSRQAFQKGWTPLRREQAAQQQVAGQDQQGGNQVTLGQSGQHTPDNCGGFAYELHYNGVKQELKPIVGKQGSSQPEYEAPPAMPGTTITMYTTRVDTTGGKMGLLLLVNGRSTWKQENGDINSMRRWIYGSESTNKEEYKGFYEGLTGKNLLPFKVLTAEDSVTKAAEFGTHAGWIHLHVFHSSDQPQAQQYASEMLVSTRAIPRGLSRGSSLKTVREALLKANHVQVKKNTKGFASSRDAGGGLIVNELELVPDVTLTTDVLPNPELKASIAIRYWDKGGRKIEEQTTQQQKK